MPAVIAVAGDKAKMAYLDFFTATIRNRHTRRAYAFAVGEFLRRCEVGGVALGEVQPFHVSAHIETLTHGREENGKATHGAATVLQHLSALRQFFGFLHQRGAVESNPALYVKGPTLRRREGKTPVLAPEDAQGLLDSIEGESLKGKRDKALIAVMLYSFARIGAVIQLRVKDVVRQGTRYTLHLLEKGGSDRRVPCHPALAEILHDWMEAAELVEGEALLFPSFRKGNRMTGRALSEQAVLEMVKGRAAVVGVSASHICCHSFRATGITTYLMCGGALESAAEMAGHVNIATTRLYDRRRSFDLMRDIDRLRFETPKY